MKVVIMVADEMRVEQIAVWETGALLRLASAQADQGKMEVAAELLASAEAKLAI